MLESAVYAWFAGRECGSHFCDRDAEAVEIDCPYCGLLHDRRSTLTRCEPSCETSALNPGSCSPGQFMLPGLNV